MPSDAVLKQISDLLKDGKVQDAADLLAKVRVDVQAESAPVVSSEPPLPRQPNEVIFDLFHGIVSHLGFPAFLESLLYELESVIGGSTKV